MLRVFGMALVAGVLFVTSSGRASSVDDPSGIWLTQAGDAKVAVSRCGPAICGRVVWLRAPIDEATGKPQIDNKNPNPSLAKRQIIGLHLFIGMKPQGTRKWSGRVYNADDGKTYASKVTLEDTTKLRVDGCIGSLCGGETWSKQGK
ncbi:MAG: DUF2147 domain-containing protein [Xanthobacteraceae bacterium]|nr:DUF2147 domain-containing protein [Xanthobacteraceae bacterium]